jgi:hypothetical protein
MLKLVTAVALGAATLALAATAGATKPGGGSTATGSVFWVNPVQSLQDEELTDQKDAATAVPPAAYRQVTLTNLLGTGFLDGDYVRVRNETGPSAYSPTGDFTYTRDEPQFEQVMAYYWITEAQKYLQRLGFTGGSAILDEGIDVRINQWGQDNSFFWDKHHYLRFGKGGVDDAEDAEVILHEYGHAIQDSQVTGFGTTPDSGAIGEGFGDYFAVSFGNAKTGNTFEPACVMDWDSTSYTSGPVHCLRRTDSNLHYPEDLHPQREVHADGRLWSRALWDVNQALGNVAADKIIIGAQFSFSADTSFQAAAIATVHYAKLTNPGAVDTVCAAFVDRGFITTADCASA